MKILVDNKGNIIAIGSICEFGYWADEPSRQKWKIDEHSYALDYGYAAYDVEEVPSDVERYLYINGEFIENPDWEEPPKSEADRIADLEAQNTELTEQLALTELTMIENYEAQENINAQTENALIEIYEMMEG